MAERKVTFIIGANIKNFTDGLSKAQVSFKKFGENMKAAGRTMSTYVTAPLVALGTISVKSAADFEQSMSKITGLVGIASREVNAMRSEVLGMAGETARAPQELADALFFVTSAGLRGKDAMEVLNISAKAAAAGLGTTKDVADLVTSAVNAYGIQNLSASKATDILVAAVREGKAEASSLAQSMGQVLPIASNMGVSFDQVGAAIAGMTRTGTNAETAAIQLRQILADLLQPSKQAEDALNRMGTSSAILRQELREKGLLSVLGFLRDQMKTNEQAMAEVFGNVRSLSGALDLMGANASDNIGIFDRMTDASGSLNAAFETASNTTSFKFQSALAELKTAGIELGNILIPVATKIIGIVKGLVSAFQGMSSESKTLTVIIAGFAAAIGPALIALGTMATVIGSVSLPIAAVIGGLAALAAGFVYVSENWEAIKERISDWGWWRNALVDMAQFFIEYSPFSLAIKGMNELIEFFGGTAIPNPFEAMSESIEGLKGETKEYEHDFGSFTDAVMAKWDKVKNSLLSFGSSVGIGTGGGAVTGEGLPTSASQPMLISAPTEVFGPADYLEDFDKLQVAIDTTADKAWDLSGIFNNVFSGMQNVITNAFNGTTNVLDGFKKFFFDFIKGMVAKLIAATIAALALTAVLSFIPGFGGANAFKGVKEATGFGGKLKAGIQAISGMESGGVVPGGFPNDSYPAFLSSGETVLPSPKSLPSGIMGDQAIRVTGTIRADKNDLLVLIEDAQRERYNTN